MSHKIRNIFSYHIFFHSLYLIRVEKKQIEPYHFRKLSPFVKVTMKNATPNEVNNPIGQIITGCVSLSIGI